MKRYTAGCVVIGPTKQVLVVNQNGDSWSLPKGGIDEGETPLEAAVREVYEESGVKDVTVMKKLGEYERPRIGEDGVGDHPSETKHITMYLCITDQQQLSPLDPVNPEARWVNVDDVASMLTHKKDIEFYMSAMSDVTALLQQ